MSNIHVGLVGYGLAGSVFHAPLIRSVPRFRLDCVVTSRREQASRELPGTQVVSGVRDLLTDPSIDLVVIATPNATHAKMARDALLAGKHVVVDKPLALTAQDCEGLMALADSRKLRLSVFHNRRWDNDYLTVKYCIGQEWLGEVYSYEEHFDRFRPQIKTGWREEPGPGAGLLYDLGTHLIDHALQLFGVPREVTADVIGQRQAAQVDDYFHLVLDYGRLRVVLHAATLVAAPGPRFAVHGTGGSFLKFGTDPQEQALKQGARPGNPEWGLDSPEDYGALVSADGSRRALQTLRGGYEGYYLALAECLQGAAPVPVDPRDARDGLMVIEAAIRSAAERRSVAIP